MTRVRIQSSLFSATTRNTCLLGALHLSRDYHRMCHIRLNPAEFGFNMKSLKPHPDEVSMDTLAKTLPKVYLRYKIFFLEISEERVKEMQNLILSTGRYRLKPIQLVEEIPHFNDYQLVYSKDSERKHVDLLNNLYYLELMVSKRAYHSPLLIGNEANDLNQFFNADPHIEDRLVLLTLAVLLTYIISTTYPPFTDSCCWHWNDKERNIRNPNYMNYFKKICCKNEVYRLYKVDLRLGTFCMDPQVLCNDLTNIVKNSQLLNLIKEFIFLPMLDKGGNDLKGILNTPIPVSDVISNLLLDFYLTRLDIKYKVLHPRDNYVRLGDELFISIPASFERLYDKKEYFSDIYEFFLDYGIIKKELISYYDSEFEFKSLKSQYYGSLHLTYNGILVSNIYHAALMKPVNITPYYMDRERVIDKKYIGNSDLQKNDVDSVPKNPYLVSMEYQNPIKKDVDSVPYLVNMEYQNPIKNDVSSEVPSEGLSDYDELSEADHEDSEDESS